MATELLVTAQYAEDADAMFEKASSFADMIEVTRKISSYEGLPALPMVQGRTYRTNVKVFGLLETKDYAIRIDTLCKTMRRMQSSEHSEKVKSWKHTLDVMPHGEGSIWTDRVCIDAGWSTPLLVRYARFMYLHRHTQRGAQSVTAVIQKSPRIYLPDVAAFQARD
ncbi:hypothetical protein [Aestuariivita boseongensis]|uniref:hypothetical protein n=1 Tax=Aestuariivita boseongensis TaxID=1470562 RepID=UPI00067FFB6B|nr:hypothetical protein [Aestuariivita boseongensis]